MLVSRVTLAGTILTPGFGDQAGDIVLCVAKPGRLLTPILAEFVQYPMRQVSPQCIRREFIRGFPVRTRRLVHCAQQVVRDVQVVLGCHDALCSSVPQTCQAIHTAISPLMRRGRRMSRAALSFWFWA